MTHFCPACGYNLEADQPVERDGWRIIPNVAVWYGDKLVTRRITWSNILHTLAAAPDCRVMPEALLARISDSEVKNILASQVSQMRKHFREIAVPDPIASRVGRGGGGYWWKAAA